MSAEQRQALALAARNDLYFFILRVFQTLNPGAIFLENWHIEAIVHQLERVERGETSRLVITQPPRTMKSLATSVAWVAYLLGRNPALKIICVSYSSDLALTFARQFRQVVESAWYKQAFPGTKAHRVTDDEFTTTKGGYRLTTSIGGTLTGRGADIIIIDDPMKAEDAMSEAARRRVIDWYSTSLVSRLNDQDRGAIVLVMQRLHEEDLAGHVLGDPGWAHLDLPAIAQDTRIMELGRGRTHVFREGDLLHPDYLSRKALDRLRHDLGTFAFTAQYLQQPGSPQGNLIKWDWFRIFTESPPLHPGQVVMSIDTAHKTGDNDYSVCTIWVRRNGGDENLLVHVHRERLEYPDLLAKVKALIGEWNVYKVLIEDHGVGSALAQQLRQQSDVAIWGIKPKLDKAARFAKVTHLIEQGKVYVPMEALWLGEFKRELSAFPHVRHDDQVDSVSQYLDWSDDAARSTTGQHEIIGLMG